MTSTPHVSSAQPTTPKLQGWVKWLLIGSLAANLMIVGAVASLFWRGPPAAVLNATLGGGANLAGYVGSLPNDRRREILSRAQPVRQEMMGLRRDIRIARRDMFAVLGAEPFDKQRFLDAQTRLMDVELRQRTVMRPWLAEMAAGMSSEERRTFLKWRGRQRPGQQGADDDLVDLQSSKAVVPLSRQFFPEA